MENKNELEEYRMDERRRISEAHSKGEITDQEYHRRLKEIAKTVNTP